MNLQFCYLLLCVATLVPWVTCLRLEPDEMYVSVTKYFPNTAHLTTVTWAHAVNSHELLEAALEDDKVMMLEADVMMGHHVESMSHEVEGQVQIPVMVHPPEIKSDLSFMEFVDKVIEATSSGKKKGIKLDFKDIEPVDHCLKLLRTKLQERSVKIPVFINADILKGPVNATKTPLDPIKFLTLAKKHATYAVLSVGWTTRYGWDDPTSEEIHEGEYTKDQMKEMHKLLRKEVGDPPVFPHITFPVRAGLAAQSMDNLLWLTSRVKDSSLTLWSPPTDKVNRRNLEQLIAQQQRHRTFLDLPFSLDEPHEDEHSHEHFNDSDKPHEEPVSGRGHNEDASSGAFNNTPSIIFVGVLAFITSLLIIHMNSKSL